jgi:hypothetical protein
VHATRDARLRQLFGVPRGELGRGHSFALALSRALHPSSQPPVTYNQHPATGGSIGHRATHTSPCQSQHPQGFDWSPSHPLHPITTRTLRASQERRDDRCARRQAGAGRLLAPECVLIVYWSWSASSALTAERDAPACMTTRHQAFALDTVSPLSHRRACVPHPLNTPIHNP